MTTCIYITKEKKRQSTYDTVTPISAILGFNKNNKQKGISPMSRLRILLCKLIKTLLTKCLKCVTIVTFDLK